MRIDKNEKNKYKPSIELNRTRIHTKHSSYQCNPQRSKDQKYIVRKIKNTQSAREKMDFSMYFFASFFPHLTLHLNRNVDGILIVYCCVVVVPTNIKSYFIVNRGIHFIVSMLGRCRCRFRFFVFICSCRNHSKLVCGSGYKLCTFSHYFPIRYCSKEENYMLLYSL